MAGGPEAGLQERRGMLIEERRMEVDQLRPGMFVSRLDRDWAGTPFLLQGFVVDGDEDIARIRRYCSYVYIDVEKSHEVDFSLLSLEARAVPDRGADPPQEKIDVLAALPHAAEAVEYAASGVAEIFSVLEQGHPVVRRQAEAVIQPIIDSLARHPDAFFWLQALRRHEDYAYGHAVNCSALAVALGRQIGLPEGALRDLAIGCLLLDIGMTRVPLEVLRKEQPLSEAERGTVRAHVAEGAEMYVSSSLDDLAVVEMIRGHHERHDGSGYPHGLEGADIPMYCRIAGLVDSYDAMITARPYHKALSPHDALQRLYRERNRSFQDEIVEQFMQCMGIYPVGSLVELDSGEVAIVMAQNRVRRLRPTLMLLTDADKQIRTHFLPVDLMVADRTGSPESRLRITRGLEPGAYGLDPRELYL